MLIEYKSMLIHKTQTIRIAKRQYLNKINKIIQNSSFNDKLTWRLIKKNKHPHNVIPTLEYKNNSISDPSEKAEMLHSVLCHPNNPVLEPKHIKFHTKINQKIKNLKLNIPQYYHPIDTLNSPIQKYEVINCINELDEDKAYGPDLIHNQMIINGGPILWTQLLSLFNKCLKTGSFRHVNFGCMLSPTQQTSNKLKN